MFVCQPPVHDVGKVAEVVEELEDVLVNPPRILLERRWRFMFGRDGLAAPELFKELFLKLFRSVNSRSPQSNGGQSVHDHNYRQKLK